MRYLIEIFFLLQHTIWRQLCTLRHNKKFLLHKASIWSAFSKIVQNWISCFLYSSFDRVSFQRPHRISCSFSLSAFQFSGSIQISQFYVNWVSISFFNFCGVEALASTFFFLMASDGFIPGNLVYSLFTALMTSGSLLTHSVLITLLPFLSSSKISCAY